MTFQSPASLKIPFQPAAPVLQLHGQRKVFTVPFGLKTLLEEMTRETLRENPANIYTFLADLLEKKLVARDKTEIAQGGKKSWQWRRWSWDGSSLLSNEELVEFLSQYRITLEEANYLATIIQAAYRGFITRKEFHPKQDQQKRREHLWDEWRHEGNLYVSAKDVQDILAYYGISLFEANAFATKIQKVFRGHIERERLLAEHPELAEHLAAMGITRACAEAHATRIQSVFRGYRVRKAMKEGKYSFGAQDEEEDETDAEEDEYGESQYYAREMKQYMTEEGGEQGEMYASPSMIANEEERAAEARRMQAMKFAMEMQQTESETNFEVEEYEYRGEGSRGGQYEKSKSRVNIPKPAVPRPVTQSEPNPKYDAYFPEGFDDESHGIEDDGTVLPPKFTHQHFGDIDPLEVKAKFSDTNFRNKMSYILKDLGQAMNENAPVVQPSTKAIPVVQASKAQVQQQQQRQQSTVVTPSVKPAASVSKVIRSQLSVVQTQGESFPPSVAAEQAPAPALQSQLSVAQLEAGAVISVDQLRETLAEKSEGQDETIPKVEKSRLAVQQSVQLGESVDKSQDESLPPVEALQSQFSVTELQAGSIISVDQLRASLAEKSEDQDESIPNVEKSRLEVQQSVQLRGSIDNSQQSRLSIQKSVQLEGPRTGSIPKVNQSLLSVQKSVQQTQQSRLSVQKSVQKVEKSRLSIQKSVQPGKSADKPQQSRLSVQESVQLRGPRAGSLPKADDLLASLTQIPTEATEVPKAEASRSSVSGSLPKPGGILGTGDD